MPLFYGWFIDPYHRYQISTNRYQVPNQFIRTIRTIL
jgi:hypothetical protein